MKWSFPSNLWRSLDDTGWAIPHGYAVLLPYPGGPPSFMESVLRLRASPCIEANSTVVWDSCHPRGIKVCRWFKHGQEDVVDVSEQSLMTLASSRGLPHECFMTDQHVELRCSLRSLGQKGQRFRRRTKPKYDVDSQLTTFRRRIAVVHLSTLDEFKVGIEFVLQSHEVRLCITPRP